MTARMGTVGLLVTLTACAVDAPNDPVSTDADLRLGSRGDSVQALQDYLARFGYFPNEDLQRQYPAWRPIVSQAPTRGVFDQPTDAAVRAFQKNTRLEQTGVVDSATRAFLQQPRCGFPDGIAAADPSDKFAIAGPKWSSSTVTWKVTNNNDVTLTQAKDAARAAFATWAAQTHLTFNEVTGTADIMITFGTIDMGGGPNGNILAFANFPGSGSGGDITIDDFENWSVATPTPAGNVDLQNVILHEIGHSLGLNHSSFASATMFPSIAGGTQDRTLDLDDDTGISAVYDTWEQLPGLAKDIGVGGNGTVWIIGTNSVGGGGDFGIWKWNGSGWVATDGGGVRIATEPGGNPWIVNAAGQIFRRTTNSTSSGGWEQISGAAKDIGVGFNGSVWIITATAVGGAGDFTVAKRVGSTWVTTTQVGGGIRIAVGPSGVPWMVNTVGSIYRLSNNDPASGSWGSPLPGAAKDIGIGDANVNGGQYAWVIGTNSVGNGDFGIFVWNEQTQLLASDGVTVTAPGKFGWAGVSGGARNISVGPNGTPWIVNNAGTIFRPQN